MRAGGRRLQVTFDAADPHALCEWWADLLGYEVERDQDMITSLLEQGVIERDILVERDGLLFFADAAACHDPVGTNPRLFFQRVPEGKTTKNRVHLDVPVDAEALDAEAERAVGLGATLVGFDSYPGHRWAVMRDPEGNEFCLH